ncbi:daptide biosynthesis RiPP recognition protein [Polymorphospora rubra]|uniref:daptide biosynthesis RiPP recognition protein n=1 Tax=Polymorphospora rubra TaxID=338584 RepID=UPI0033DF3D6D
MSEQHTAPSLARIREHLMAWTTGTPLPDRGTGAATVLLDDPAHLDALLRGGLADPQGVIFVPGAGTGDPRIVGYDGSPAEPGGELSVNDEFYLQIQDYAAAAFMVLVGPTLVTVGNTDDFRYFLADADRARSTGGFPEFAIAGPVRLANLPGLGAGPAGDGPDRRLHVDADGAVSTSVAGVRIGTVGDGPAALRDAWLRRNDASDAPCAVCLDGAVDETERAGAVAARPWLGRYLAAIASLRTLNANGVADLRVSGFGGRLLAPLEGVDDPADQPGTPAAVLLWTAESGYLHLPATNRSFALSLAAARLAEALLVCGSVDAAAAFADHGKLLQVATFFADAGVRLVAAEPVAAGDGR